jgi:hypothetical protein
MNVSPVQDARDLVRFLLSSAGHPVVLDREDCALLADRIELARVLEEAAQKGGIAVPARGYCPLTN